MHKSLAITLVLTLLFTAGISHADDWPQWRGINRDGNWNESGLIDQFESDEIKLKWRIPIGPGYSGPTVSDGRVFITYRIAEPQQERVLCVSEKTGEELWSYTYPCEYRIGYTAGPRASVTVENNKAYALGAMGHLHCFDADSGKVLWNRDLNTDYKIKMPIWGIAGSPIIHEDTIVLQIGGSDVCVIGLNKYTGKSQWGALKERACYAAPVLVNQGGVPVVVCWTGDSVSGVDPKSGKVFWNHPFPPSRMPIGVATPVISGNDLFVTSFYDGSLLLRLGKDKPAIEKVWQQTGLTERETRGIHSIISTPVFEDGFIYGVDSYGELRCLDAKNGERVWEDQTATPRARWSTIHFVKNFDRYWMFNERGELIIGKLSPDGFKEISRAKLIEPTRDQLNQRNGVCWAHPAFANKHVFARNDKELVCASLAK